MERDWVRPAALAMAGVAGMYGAGLLLQREPAGAAGLWLLAVVGVAGLALSVGAAWRIVARIIR